MYPSFYHYRSVLCDDNNKRETIQCESKQLIQLQFKIFISFGRNKIAITTSISVRVQKEDVYKLTDDVDFWT